MTKRTRKLSLKRETLKTLASAELDQVQGGAYGVWAVVTVNNCGYNKKVLKDVTSGSVTR